MILSYKNSKIWITKKRKKDMHKNKQYLKHKPKTAKGDGTKCFVFSLF